MKIKYERIKGYNISIVLPYCYNKNDKYGVIYIQDAGKPAFQSLNQLDHLMRSRTIEPLIIVGIEPQCRIDDYTPWPATATVEGKADFGGCAKRYLNDLIYSIKPFIEQNYIVHSEREHTAIAGCSLGGLLTIFASYWHPDIFGKYIAISPSLWYKDVIKFISLKDFKPAVNRKVQKMYLYVGELEGIYKQTVQKHITDNAVHAYKYFQEEGFDNNNLLLETDPEGTHDYLFFSRYFISALKWMYRL